MLQVNTRLVKTALIRIETIVFSDYLARLMRVFLSVVLIITSTALKAQIEFRFKTDVPVSIQGQPLSQPWEGGLNAAQFQTMDLNADGLDDLVIYNRISRDISTYLNFNNQYIWSPEFAYQFPDDVIHWLILKDFDCDGLKDIFTSTALGIKVYRNTTAGNKLTWEVAKPFLSFDSGTNIQVSPNDIPGIADIDGDGALDILTYRFGTSTTVDYFQNTGTCGSLEFTRAERQWGGFTECNCDSFAFNGNPCPQGEIPSAAFGVNAPEAILHAGGKTILPFDADNDGDIDIISSDEFCESLYFLENTGDNLNAQMNSLASFPINNPASFKIFPSAFLEDVDFDGIADLIISTNADENIGNQIDLRNNVKFYSNQGSIASPIFNQASTPFLQQTMIDLGENTYPSFTDIDDDGDLDLIVGNKGLTDNQGLTSTLYKFSNSGNRFAPAFNITDNNLFNFEPFGYSHIKPQFIDADADGDSDLFYQATLSINDTRLFFQEATTTGIFQPPLELNISSTVDDNPFFYDIDEDGDMDLLLGKRLGSLSLFINQGNFVFGPESLNFGGIANNFQALNLWPHVADLDGDNEAELITINATGRINIYEGPVDEGFIAGSPETEILNINNLPFTTNLGRQNSITSADIFNTGKPAIIVGSAKGGMYLLENISTNGRTSAGQIEIEISPNPTQNTLSVLTNTDGIAEIYDTIGRKKYFNINIQSGVRKVLNLSVLPAGVYILRIVNSDNVAATKKILVHQ